MEIESKVTAAGEDEETSMVILNYVPGHSARQGGLLFTRNPHSSSLAVRAIGFAKP
jgi:uncharacterized protein (TIGR02588 family)